MTTISPNHGARTIDRLASTLPCHVVDTPLGASLVASRTIAAGETVLSIEGRLQRTPTRYSIQLDHDTHIEADGDLPEDAMRARHPWRFLDHSCSPNARIAGRILVAIAPITAGSHITFDYTTTEASMSTPFDCHCGAAACLGTVRGFLHLTPEQQRVRGPWLAPHLRDALSR